MSIKKFQEQIKKARFGIKAEIYRLYMEGMSIIKIQKKLNLKTRQGVYYHLGRLSTEEITEHTRQLTMKNRGEKDKNE